MKIQSYGYQRSGSEGAAGDPMAWVRFRWSRSRRTDVPTNHLPEGFVPKKGVKYIENIGEKSFPLDREVLAYVKSILRR